MGGSLPSRREVRDGKEEWILNETISPVTKKRITIAIYVACGLFAWAMCVRAIAEFISG
jgi:hypothetical protein